MHPHTTFKRLLVLPKDKVEPEEQSEVVYHIPCKNRGAESIGQTVRLLNTSGRTQEGIKQHDKMRNTHTKSGRNINVCQ